MASTFLNALSETPKIHTYPFVDSFFSKKRETAWLDDDTKSEEVSFFLCGGGDLVVVVSEISSEKSR